MLKISIQWVSVVLLACTMSLLAGCTATGPTVITDEDDTPVSGKEHKINVFTPKSDSKPLSVLVRQALGNNGQTVTSRIQVSQDSSDTVKLSGYVNNDSVRYEAERVAYSVEGVRVVVNNLYIRD